MTEATRDLFHRPEAAAMAGVRVQAVNGAALRWTSRQRDGKVKANIYAKMGGQRPVAKPKRR